MDKILEAGASIIIRPVGWPGFRFMGTKYAVCIEYRDLRNGLSGDDLEAIWANALEWMKDVDFYFGSQWTVEQIAQMRQARAS